MCVILTLPAGINIDDDKLDCAIANNWHGYGIVLKDERMKRLEVRRNYNAEGGANPEEVARILRENDDIIRYVHLRHTTAGENGIENCHPFPVYNSNAREVYMMHNGTIYDYKPSHGDDRSDTRKFAEEFVSDLLLHFEGDMGKGDYNYPIIKKIIEKQVGASNKILFISNDLDPLYCNDWVTIRNKDGSEFKASNNEYFTSIKRGPRYTVTPFRGHQTNTQVSVVGGTTQTTSTVHTSGSGATSNSGGRFHQTGTALVTEAKEARKTEITKLQEVENIKPEYTPPKALLESLGSSEATFLEWGFDSFLWLKDEEIAQGLRKLSPSCLVELFRALIETTINAQEDLNHMSETIEDQNDLIEKLETKNKAASRRIAELMQGSQQELRKVG